VDAHDELLAAAVDITRAASGLAALRFLEGVPVSTKADDTEVTPADVEVEELIRSLIAARFPGDGLTGEELEDTPGDLRPPVPEATECTAEQWQSPSTFRQRPSGCHLGQPAPVAEAPQVPAGRSPRLGHISHQPSGLSA
jgi:3'-phosphoadenosine 5'-phosphosulfate (PAPS) 3'-phosphatase